MKLMFIAPLWFVAMLITAIGEVLCMVCEKICPELDSESTT